jgi:hypothetical protein
LTEQEVDAAANDSSGALMTVRRLLPFVLFLLFIEPLHPPTAQEHPAVSGVPTVVQSQAASTSHPKSKEIQIPNGTPVYLRFAQPVVGVPQATPKSVDHANKGDLVRLVVAADVRVNGLLLLPKGSPAQVTVMKANAPSFSTYCRTCVATPDSGLELRFDWVKSVNGQEVPLRHKRNGNKSSKFPVVLSSRFGSHLVTDFSWERRDIKEGLDMMIKAETGQQWTVIPTGTRVKAYVNRDTSLDAASVIAVLALLPQPNSTATVTVYRETGPKDQLCRVVCDEKTFGALGDHEHIVFETDPGKHSCHLDHGETLAFSVSAGEEFYLFMHYSSFAGKWEITAVDPATGEDAVAFSHPIVSPPPGAQTQP